jgi:hypothetical protein
MKLAIPDMISDSYFPQSRRLSSIFRREGLDVSLRMIFPVDKAYAALRVGRWITSAARAFRARRVPRMERVSCLRARAGDVLVSVMHADFKAKRGDVSVSEARDWCGALGRYGLARSLASGIDLVRDK